MKNNIYNVIIFIVSLSSFLTLIYFDAPWWAYLLYLIIIEELS